MFRRITLVIGFALAGMVASLAVPPVVLAAGTACSVTVPSGEPYGDPVVYGLTLTNTGTTTIHQVSLNFYSGTYVPFFVSDSESGVSTYFSNADDYRINVSVAPGDTLSIGPSFNDESGESGYISWGIYASQDTDNSYSDIAHCLGDTTETVVPSDTSPSPSPSPTPTSTLSPTPSPTDFPGWDGTAAATADDFIPLYFGMAVIGVIGIVYLAYQMVVKPFLRKK